VKALIEASRLPKRSTNSSRVAGERSSPHEAAERVALRKRSGRLPEHVKLRAAPGLIGGEMHEILEDLPLTHRVVPVPSGELELGHATIRLNVIGARWVIAGGERRAPQNLTGLH
jgi:hypothetical protein